MFSHWSHDMRRAALITALATVAMIAVTLIYLRVFAAADIDGWVFAKVAFVIAAVWAAIGGVMGFFIVMIVKKNGKG